MPQGDQPIEFGAERSVEPGVLGGVHYDGAPVRAISKLRSRKFWAAIIGGVVIIFAKNLGVDEGQAQMFVEVVIGYLVAQGWVDGKAAA